MRQPKVSLFLFGAVLCALVAGTAEAVMVDFESPTYTAGSPFVGVDNWLDYLGATTVITPDPVWSGDMRVLEGAQSARLGGDPVKPRSIVVRKFNPGPTKYGTGTTVRGRMLVEDSLVVGGSGEFYFSDLVASSSTVGSTTPAGIVGFVGGNFNLFGKNAGGVVGNIDTGIPFATNADYLLEMELQLQDQTFTAYATNRTLGGPRTTLGTAFFAGTVTVSEYVNSGWALITRNNAVAIYDDMDVEVVPPGTGDQPLPGMVDFENPVYVAGAPVTGSGVKPVDTWTYYLSATTVVTPDGGGSGDTRVLDGTKSLRLTGTRSTVLRNLGPGSTYDDGSVVSARMMVSGLAVGGSGQFYFSHNMSALATPAGIVGFVDGNFAIFGQNAAGVNGNIDTGVPFLKDVDYLLEMEFDLTAQTFDSFVTNLTAGDPRVNLGTTKFALAVGATVLPGDDSNAGFVFTTKNDAVGIFDNLNIWTPVLLPGDANGDGKVDDADASALAANWLTIGGATWAQGDFNKDGNVDDLDASILAANWPSGGGAAVPEPSVLASLLGLLLGALMVRRGRAAQ